MATVNWIKTKYPGVYYLESETKLFKRKPDRCLYVTFKAQGKKVWEKSAGCLRGMTPKRRPVFGGTV